MGEIARNIPKINAALEDSHAEYQPIMVEFEDKKFNEDSRLEWLSSHGLNRIGARAMTISMF